MERFSWIYWEHLLVLARLGDYYRSPFKGYQGVPLGEPLSFTIFNTVVGGVILQWVTLVAEKGAGPEGFRRVVQWLVELFYSKIVSLFHLICPSLRQSWVSWWGSLIGLVSKPTSTRWGVWSVSHVAWLAGTHSRPKRVRWLGWVYHSGNDNGIGHDSCRVDSINVCSK